MIEKLFLCGYTPTPLKREVLKTALGSEKSVAWEYVKDPKEVITKLKAKGIKIGALELTECSLTNYNFSKINFPIALIVGNEITGVSQDLLDLCDFSLEIPQHGTKQSLNAAVAYGISVFDLRRVFDANI
ncbi:MAG: TrmH family RNA methyltransferase [Bacteroidota bacterium]